GRLVSHYSEIGGAVALHGLDPAPAQFRTQRWWKRGSGDECALDARRITADLFRGVEKHLEEVRRAGVAAGLQAFDGFNLDLGVSGACRHHRAAQGKGTLLDRKSVV